MLQKIYPHSKDKETVYLKSVITNSNIIVGDYTMYNDFVKEPKDFEKNNVLYQYPINQDKLITGKFYSIKIFLLTFTINNSTIDNSKRKGEKQYVIHRFSGAWYRVGKTAKCL